MRLQRALDEAWLLHQRNFPSPVLKRLVEGYNVTDELALTHVECLTRVETRPDCRVYQGQLGPPSEARGCFIPAI